MKNIKTRTFISIPIPSTVRSLKQMLFSTLQDQKSVINWVKSINLNMTLKFWGDVDSNNLEKIARITEKVLTSYTQFELEVNDTGSFSNNGKHNILWLGIKENMILKELVENLETSFEKIEFPKNENQFLPHITLAKINYPQKYIPNINMFLNSSFIPISFKVKNINLIESKINDTGINYKILNTFHLDENK